MNNNNDKNFFIERPFGPAVAEFKVEKNLIDQVNSYTENIIQNKNKADELDNGSRLAGQVTQEIKMEDSFFYENIKTTLDDALCKYVFHSLKGFESKDEVKKKILIQYHTGWIVRQFENEYNPLHLHTGSVSGVCYTMLPENFGEKAQKNKKENPNGCIVLAHGSQQFTSPAIKVIKPEIGKFILFPNYLLHSVYPFKGKGERRSFSFNASINLKNS